MAQPTAPSTSALFVKAKNSVLLQTAKGYIARAESTENTIVSRLLFDSGSHRSYISERLRNALGLPTIAKETLSINTLAEKKERIKNVM